jgi:four helix bundle protein
MPEVIVYRDLEAWKQAMDLAQNCYSLSAVFPRTEIYGLTSQLRRAAASIPSNLAEGYSRRTTRAYAYHVTIALGSHAEVETCLELASRLGFLSGSDRQRIQAVVDSVGRLLSGLYRSLEEKIRRGTARHSAG